MKNRYCLFLILGCCYLIIGSCDIFNKAETTLIPTSGKNPIPDITGTEYRNIELRTKSSGGNQRAQINWGKIEPLLKKIQSQTNHSYVAFYSVQEFNDGIYTYRTSPLAFSQEAVKQANGNIKPYLFESTANTDTPVQLLAAYIPDSKQAEKEMLQWILSKPKEGTIFKLSDTVAQKEMLATEMCWYHVKTYHVYIGGETQTIYVFMEEPCIVVTPDDDDDSSGGGDLGGGVPCDEQLLPPPECSDDDPGLPPSGGDYPSLPLEIIIDDSFEDNTCLSSVYNQAGQVPAYQNILQNFDGEFSVANLILSAGVEPGYENANAVTYEPINYNIEIMFNPNKLERPQLSVARTLMHELIHAEMYRKLLSAAQQNEIPWSETFINSIRNDFPGIYDYYRRYKNWQHQQMAQHYRGIIEQGLRQFNNSFPDEVYESLAWNGLGGTVAWNNLGSDKKNSIIQAINNFRSNHPPCSN